MMRNMLHTKQMYADPGESSGVRKTAAVPLPTVWEESVPTVEVSAPETTAGSGKTFLQKLSDVLSFKQNMENANSVMAMGALLNDEELENTGVYLGQSATENYLDSVKEFGYIAERGVGGAAKSVEGTVNALGYLGQYNLQAQALQTASQYEALGNLTGIGRYKGVAESYGGIAQDLHSKGLQDTAKFGTKYQQSIQDKYADANITKTGRALGDVSETVGGLAPSAVMNVIAPGSGIAVSALSAGGNATQEALANGASDHEALAYGTAVGVIEAATEKIFDGVAGIFGKGAADDVIESMAKKLAKSEGAQGAIAKIANSLGEGFEEFLTEFATRVANELIVDTDDRSVLQTLGDAGYNALMGAIVGGVVQTADGMIKSVRSDPKALAQQAADAAIAQFKAQTGDAAKPTLAQQIDSMRQQLADTQHKQKVDALLAAYEENVGPTAYKVEIGQSVQRESTVAQETFSRYNNIIEKHVQVNHTSLLQNAKEGGRHKGIYTDALQKDQRRLEKSIASHTAQVEEHAEKIANPSMYDVGWDNKDQRAREGLLRKWEKDMKRNAEQATIEIAIWEERYGDEQ